MSADTRKDEYFVSRRTKLIVSLATKDKDNVIIPLQAGSDSCKDKDKDANSALTTSNDNFLNDRELKTPQNDSCKHKDKNGIFLAPTTSDNNSSVNDEELKHGQLESKHGICEIASLFCGENDDLLEVNQLDIQSLPVSIIEEIEDGVEIVETYDDIQQTTSHDIFESNDNIVTDSDAELLRDISNIDEENQIQIMDTDENQTQMETDDLGRESQEQDNNEVDETSKVGSGGRRKPKCNKKKIDRKLCKGKGKAYTTCKGKDIPARKVKPSCKNMCLKKCATKINMDSRQKIHNDFWQLENVQKKDFILRCVNKNKKARETVTGTSRRQFTRSYFLPFNEEFIEVCKMFFMNTLDVGAKFIRYTEEHASPLGSAASDKRGLSTPANKTGPHSLKAVRNFIESLPAVPSHYCRNSSNKKYLPQEFESLAHVHRLYMEHCKNIGLKAVSESVFKKVFRTEYNIGIHSPKKDKCTVCVSYKSLPSPSTSQQEAQQKHKQEEEDIGKRYKQDQERSKQNGDFITTSFDMEKVLNTPHGKSILFFYARKYAMYNLTFYESGTQQTYCYMWGESDGHRGSTEICTIMWKYLNLLDERGVKEVALYCDNCAGQQKNIAMFVLITEFIKQSKTLKKIGLNFLLVGHSMMTVDSVHGVIERNIAKKTVYAPSEWPTIVTNARINPFPYEVISMKRNEFRDWKEYSTGFKIENEEGRKLMISAVQRVYWSKTDVLNRGTIDVYRKIQNVESARIMVKNMNKERFGSCGALSAGSGMEVVPGDSSLPYPDCCSRVVHKP
ncbi:uncharacterized protein LOC120352054 [Nilaparvata lugens]|uniref:uncharacterized protein LOC120352054 n=1 Tax=Nilaparvata lugens TaxID=108931 RepID=UPI00193D2AC2|nr:uncharacterized protein LOC120352054 [Nilaparvata lugens]